MELQKMKPTDDVIVARLSSSFGGRIALLYKTNKPYEHYHEDGEEVPYSAIESWQTVNLPESKENEDERIRKEIVDFIRWAIDRGSITKEQRERSDTWLAYLEKQKEQKPDDQYVHGYYEGFSDSAKAYRPAEWSEEDDRIMDNCIEYIKASCLDANDLYECIDWLKSIRPQSIQLKEAYKDGFQTARHAMALAFMSYLDENRPKGKMSLSNGECEDIDKAFKEGDWAKIMRYYEKYRPSWKPSEEQMKALANALSLTKSCGEESAFDLRTLYEQLKKLM